MEKMTEGWEIEWMANKLAAIRVQPVKTVMDQMIEATQPKHQVDGCFVPKEMTATEIQMRKQDFMLRLNLKVAMARRLIDIELNSLAQIAERMLDDRNDNR